MPEENEGILFIAVTIHAMLCSQQECGCSLLQDILYYIYIYPHNQARHIYKKSLLAAL